MKESGGTGEKDINPDEVEIELDKSDEKYEEPQVYGSRASAVGATTNSKMKP